MRARCLALLAFLCASALARAGDGHVIVIEAMEFKPRTLEVRVGDTVTWTNKDMFPHTAVSSKPAVKSPQIGSGKSWSTVVRTKGDFDYICTLHPTMKARLIVK